VLPNKLRKVSVLKPRAQDANQNVRHHPTAHRPGETHENRPSEPLWQQGDADANQAQHAKDHHQQNAARDLIRVVQRHNIEQVWANIDKRTPNILPGPREQNQQKRGHPGQNPGQPAVQQLAYYRTLFQRISRQVASCHRHAKQQQIGQRHNIGDDEPLVKRYQNANHAQA
jgi:hypothetical protein